MSGSLVLVATPIGNLGDLSPRAVDALASAALICCEDTRRTGRLLVHAGVSGVKLRRVDDHTEARATNEVVDLLAGGGDVVLVSDAGTPGISDPGQRLVSAVLGAGHDVTVVPGPVAAVSALVASGHASDRFVFEGFLPRKGRERQERLALIAAEERTVVIYESPKRVAATLGALSDACGPDRRATVARELTKLHEEFVRGTFAELAAWAQSTPKGEIVVVIEGAEPPTAATDEEIIAALTEALATGSSTRDASDQVAGQLRCGRRRVYQLALGIPGPVTPPS